MRTKQLNHEALDLSIRKTAAKLNDLLKKAKDSGVPVTIAPKNTVPASDDTVPTTQSVKVIIYPVKAA